MCRNGRLRWLESEPVRFIGLPRGVPSNRQDRGFLESHVCAHNAQTWHPRHIVSDEVMVSGSLGSSKKHKVPRLRSG
jgi:hypothetical protein